MRVVLGSQEAGRRLLGDAADPYVQMLCEREMAARLKQLVPSKERFCQLQVPTPPSPCASFFCCCCLFSSFHPFRLERLRAALDARRRPASARRETRALRGLQEKGPFFFLAFLARIFPSRQCGVVRLVLAKCLRKTTRFSFSRQAPKKRAILPGSRVA